MIQNTIHTAKTSKGLVKIQINQLPAMQSGKALIRLLTTLGPSLGSLAVAMTSKKIDGFASAISALFVKLTPDEFEGLANEFLAPCTVIWGGENAAVLPVVDAMFTGHVLELYKLVGVAIRANYLDFFDGAPNSSGLLKRLMEMGAKIGVAIPMESAETPPASSGQPKD